MSPAAWRKISQPCGSSADKVNGSPATSEVMETEECYGLGRSVTSADGSSQYCNGWSGGGAHPAPPEIALTSSPHLSPRPTSDFNSREGDGSDIGSTLTSRCDSRRTSTTSTSYGVLNSADEINMLRLVNNKQKERNHELNDECNRWRFEAERWRIEVEKLNNLLAISKQ